MAWDVSRRVFLKGASMAAVGVGMGPSPLMVRAAEAAAPGTGVLVHVFFRGGFDGLNFCVPYDDPNYLSARPNIALRRSDGVIPLDSYFGLHPALGPLEPYYRDGRFGVIQAVGNLKLTRSHFDAQDFIEQGTPGVKTTADGWLGRAITQIPGATVTDQVAFSSQLPRSFFGLEPVLVTQNVSTFDLRAGTGSRSWRPQANTALRAMYQGDTEAGRVGRETFTALDTLQRNPAVLAAPAAGANYVLTGNGNNLGSSLRQAAALIKANIGVRTIFINVGGAFDTHANEIASHDLEFPRIAQSLAAFAVDLGARFDDVVVLGLTEFGRTFTENGSRGTDHGAGSTAFYMGGRVRGGRVLGRWPGLAKTQLNEQRDLMPTTDFRDLFAEALRLHVGVTDLSRVLPDYSPQPVGML
jgi:uncharacterized protein (DUF1501 family)